MKTIKKLLCTLVALTLVFCSLSSVMTVSAMNKESDYKAFSSVKVGKEKLDLKNIRLEFKYQPAGADVEEEVVLSGKTKKAKVQVKLRSGWKLKKITYYNADKDKKSKVKNGGTIKITYDMDSYIRVKAVKGNKTANIEFLVFNDPDDY